MAIDLGEHRGIAMPQEAGCLDQVGSTFDEVAGACVTSGIKGPIGQACLSEQPSPDALAEVVVVNGSALLSRKN